MVQNSIYSRAFKQLPKLGVTYGTKQHIFKGFQTITKTRCNVHKVVMYYTPANLVS